MTLGDCVLRTVYLPCGCQTYVAAAKRQGYELVCLCLVGKGDPWCGSDKCLVLRGTFERSAHVTDGKFNDGLNATVSATMPCYDDFTHILREAFE
jgi:hypothetical protein